LGPKKREPTKRYRVPSDKRNFNLFFPLVVKHTRAGSGGVTEELIFGALLKSSRKDSPFRQMVDLPWKSLDDVVLQHKFYETYHEDDDEIFQYLSPLAVIDSPLSLNWSFALESINREDMGTVSIGSTLSIRGMETKVGDARSRRSVNVHLRDFSDANNDETTRQNLNIVRGEVHDYEVYGERLFLPVKEGKAGSCRRFRDHIPLNGITEWSVWFEKPT
jgi:hypothetical protein